MGKPVKVNPAENWLGVSAPDPDLQRAIQLAQAEFAGCSVFKMTALWEEFEVLLNSWRAQGKAYAPVLHPDARVSRKPGMRGGRRRGNARPDYVETFFQLANQRFMLLPRFIRSLDRNVRRGLVKALALLVLREAAAGNPAGALKASVLFNRVLAEFLIGRMEDSQRGQQVRVVESRSNGHG
jgi:hypothetical protein